MAAEIGIELLVSIDVQELADERLAEAKALLDLERWGGAYYLAGYAVELALKACIIKMLMATDAFPDKEFSKNCYTHAIEKLVVLAKHGLVADPKGSAARVRAAKSVADALDGASYVQENVPETVDAKRAIFAELDALVRGAVEGVAGIGDTAAGIVARAVVLHIAPRERGATEQDRHRDALQLSRDRIESRMVSPAMKGPIP